MAAEALNTPDVYGFLDALGVEIKRSNGAWVRIACVQQEAHDDGDDSTASMDVNMESGGFNCHGCGITGNAATLAWLLGVNKADARRFVSTYGFKGVVTPTGSKRLPRQAPIQNSREPGDTADEPTMEKYRRQLRAAKATYDYHDESGRIIARKLRFEFTDNQSKKRKKSFAWWSPHPTERGEWRPGFGSNKPLLYNLPEVLAAKEAGTIVIVEGEKDADRLNSLDLPANVIGTTPPSGGSAAGKDEKWGEAHIEALTGARSVSIVADSDPIGLAHAHRIAASLRDVGVEVKLFQPAEGSDLSDHLDAGKTLGELIPVMPQAPAADEPVSEADDDNDELAATPAEVHEATDEDRQIVREQTGQLIDDVQAFLRRLVVVTDQEIVAVALWVLHTHAFRAYRITPYLEIFSPEKRCGKSTLMKCLSRLTWNAQKADNMSAAVMYRIVAEFKPTLLLDEADASFSGKSQHSEYAQAVRGILNSGYEEDGCVMRMTGKNHDVVGSFSTFCPKAIAGIQRLPETLQDRSISIELKRKRPNEDAEAWDQDIHPAQAQAIHDRLVTWGVHATPVLRTIRPEREETFNDRANDIWGPLFAVAIVAEGDWPEKARSAALLLSQQEEQIGFGIETLLAIQELFEEGGDELDRLTSTEIIAGLRRNKEGPWGSWWDERANNNLGGPTQKAPRSLATGLLRHQARQAPLSRPRWNAPGIPPNRLHRSLDALPHVREHAGYKRMA